MRGALVSEDRLYRYAYWNVWQDTLPTVLFIVDAPRLASDVEDPTIARCHSVTRSWKYGGFYVGSVYGLAGDLKGLPSWVDVVGSKTDECLVRMSHKASWVVAAWGPLRNAKQRVRRVISLLEPEPLFCLGQESGVPVHPLKRAVNVRPEVWKGCD